MIRNNCNRNRLHEFCNCPKSASQSVEVILHQMQFCHISPDNCFFFYATHLICGVCEMVEDGFTKSE